MLRNETAISSLPRLAAARRNGISWGLAGAGVYFGFNILGLAFQRFETVGANALVDQILYSWIYFPYRVDRRPRYTRYAELRGMTRHSLPSDFHFHGWHKKHNKNCSRLAQKAQQKFQTANVSFSRLAQKTQQTIAFGADFAVKRIRSKARIQTTSNRIRCKIALRIFEKECLPSRWNVRKSNFQGFPTKANVKKKRQPFEHIAQIFKLR